MEAELIRLRANIKALDLLLTRLTYTNDQIHKAIEIEKEHKRVQKQRN